MTSEQELVSHIDKERLHGIFSELSKKQQAIINEVCEANFIRL
jgi:hypothetical protein